MALWLVQPPQTPTRTQTVGYTGGDYFSWDPEVEALFNDQKNEFGISVDALSWIPPRANQNAVDNFQKGFLNAPNLQTRHAALLYESTLALPTAGNRINFLSYIEVEWLSALGTPELPAPVYVVGSWNEEFEGHAVFPSRFNESLSSMEQQGYDLAMAIKEAFGWNHYAKRPILP